MKTPRREFLAAVAASTVACGGHPSRWRFLTLEEANTLEAVCAHIIPADRDPGAVQAGVVNFIDRQLMGPYRRQQAAYRAGLAAIDEAAVAKFGKSFVDLDAPRQRALLESLTGPAKRFFSTVIAHTMQGYYGDPRHGGNRDVVSWRMLGVPVIPIRGRYRYQLPKQGA